MCLQSWLAWTCDMTDVFSISLSVTHLQTQFTRSTHDIVCFRRLSMAKKFLIDNVDDCYYYNSPVPFVRRCMLSFYLSRHHSRAANEHYNRSDFVSSATVSVINGNGYPSGISSLFILSKSVLVSGRRSTNSSPSDLYSVSGWVVFGVWPL